MKTKIIKLFSTSLGVAVLAGGLSLHNGKAANEEQTYQALESKIVAAVAEYGWLDIDPHDNEPNFVACQDHQLCVLASTKNLHRRLGAPLRPVRFVRGGIELVSHPAVNLND